MGATVRANQRKPIVGAVAGNEIHQLVHGTALARHTGRRWDYAATAIKHPNETVANTLAIHEPPDPSPQLFTHCQRHTSGAGGGTRHQWTATARSRRAHRSLRCSFDGRHKRIRTGRGDAPTNT